MQSEWCNRELVGFTKAYHDRGNLRVGNLQRVVKVLRLPVERSVLPHLLDEVLGAQFYRVDPASGRARDLLLDPSADALQVFRARVDDVAQDLSRLLGTMAASADAGAAALPPSAADTVFLAWTTGDLSEEREKLRRELEARNYRVVPSGSPPLDAARLRESVLAALRDAKVAIHLIGAQYGFVPEGEERSIIELQSDEAIYQASNSAAARIFWLAPNARSQDPRLSALVDRVQKQSPQVGRVDLLANQTIEALKALALDRLKPASKPAPSAAKAASATVLTGQASVFFPLATLFALTRDRGFHPPPGAWRHGATAAVLLLFWLIMLLAGLAPGEASVLVPVAQLSFVVTAGLGLVFLRETLTLHKGFGLAFAIAALICLARN